MFIAYVYAADMLSSCDETVTTRTFLTKFTIVNPVQYVTRRLHRSEDYKYKLI